MLIRQVENQIITELMKGETNFKEMATRFKLPYSTLNSIVRRMLIYNIIWRKDNGTYCVAKIDLKVGSDKEVHSFRTKHPSRNLDFGNPLPLITGEELEDLKEFVKIQCEEEVPRSIVLKRLKRYGYILSRLELLQFIEYFSLARKRKNTKEEEAEVA